MPDTVIVNATEFNDSVRQFVQAAMAIDDPVHAGAALLATWVLQMRGYSLGPQEGVSKEIIELVNKWTPMLVQDAL